MTALTDPVEAIDRQLDVAESYKDIFGPLSNADASTCKSELHSQFAGLAKMVHPDRVSSSKQERAKDVFTRLRRIYENAKIALEAGTYENTFSPGQGSSSASDDYLLYSETDTYTAAEPAFAEGDLSIILHGQSKSTSEEVLLKVATDPVFNSALEQEARIMSKFHNADAGEPLGQLASTIPKLLETFTVSDEDNRQYRVLVLSKSSGFYSVEDIIRAFPNGLDPRDAAWIARRVLGQPLAATIAGYVHTAIVPDHVLVHPITHEPLHIGWTHALSSATSPRLTSIIDRWQNWYPPEVWNKEVLDQRTDVYMAAMTVLYLFGGDTSTRKMPQSVPRDVAQNIERCLRSERDKRPEDGVEVLNNFTESIRKAWGRVYRKLEMPSSGKA